VALSLVEKERRRVAEELKRKIANEKEERELSRMWKKVAEWKNCDGTCPTCRLVSKFPVMYERKEKKEKTR